MEDDKQNAIVEASNDNPVVFNATNRALAWFHQQSPLSGFIGGMLVSIITLLSLFGIAILASGNSPDGVANEISSIFAGATETPSPTSTTSTATPTQTHTSTATATLTATFTPSPTATPTPLPPQVIINRIQPLGQLISLSVQMAQADQRISVREGFQNTCGYSANHVAQGVIEAGVNLGGIRAEDVEYDPVSEVYNITLPAPQLTSCRIDYIRQYDRSSTVCGITWDNARLLAQYETVIEFRDETLERGILERAQEEAQLVLMNFLQLATNQTVNITFEEIAEDAIVIPSSCNPEVPIGWTYDPDRDSWSN